MRLPQPPDLRAPGRFALAALAAGLAAAAILWVRVTPHLGATLGDTDDATRLVLVRDLLAGRGWFDQRVVRLQPPQGVQLHWSRLLDGGIAAWDLLWRAVLPPARAEWMTRATWPLLWVFAASAAALAWARGLAGATLRPLAGRTGLASMAVLAAGVLCAFNLELYWAQFQPGRIDHHDVQITLALVAAAGAMQAGRGRAGAVAAGAATGLGLAIGLEALVFEAAIAASFGLRLLLDRREAPRALAYGATLAAAVALAFLAQTPPARWGVAACDALGVNLLAGAVAGGLALAAAASLGARRGWAWRLGLLAAGAGLSLAVYLALDPHCLRGPFADVDPRMKPFWLDHVQEQRAWPVLWRQERDSAVSIAVFTAIGALAWALTGVLSRRWRTPAWWLSGALLALGDAAAWRYFRMDAYAMWFAVPFLAVLAAEIAGRLPRRGGVVALLIVAILLSPTLAVGGALIALKHSPWRTAPRRGGPPDTCYTAGAYAFLSRQPPGLTVSEIDLGPFVLAHTASSALAAPYHRMSRGVMAMRAIETAPADGEAQVLARAAGASYLLECRVHANHSDRDNLGPDTLQRRLDRGLPPAWLERVSPPGQALEVYRPRPPA